MIQRQQRTDEVLIEIAKRYSSRRDLKKEDSAALTSIYRRGLHELALGHMERERFYPKYEMDATARKCSTCGEEKEFSQFHKASKGFIRSMCKACSNVESNAWREANPERSREIVNKCAAKYPEKARIRSKIKRDRSPHIYAARDLLKRVLNLTGERKSRRTEQILGYTSLQLKAHIEAQFEDGMSWDDRSTWHIDHIEPVAVMHRRGITDPAVINALSNLRPLWAYDNLSKIWEARSDGRKNPDHT